MEKLDLNGMLQKVNLPPDDLKDQVVIITGSGRGIGRAAAYAFAGLGARVVIAEIGEQGDQVAEEIGSSGGQAVSFRTDVSDPESVHRLKELVINRFGRVDILVNNAIRIPVENVIDMDLATWDAVMNVNLRGTFLVTKAFLPVMLAQNQGIIINMVSTDAMPGLSAYMASKQGICGLTQSLASEVGEKGLQVIAFAPGMVDTPGIRDVAEKLAPKLGLKTDQFLNMPLHAAFDGLMPPEYAGIATAYLAARLARKYHGEQVNGYEILEEAGLIQTETISESPENPISGKSADLEKILAELQTIIQEISEEFNAMPVFIRPLARSGFKNKAGIGIQNWERISATLLSGAQNGKTPQEIHASLEKDLVNLAIYLRGVPAETQRFTSDENFMNEVREKTNHRLQVISNLLSTLQAEQAAKSAGLRL